MNRTLTVIAASAAALLVLAPVARGQVLPPSTRGMTADQIQSTLASNPALQQQFRQRIIASGLTPDQIRQRLSEAGYPPNMLDAYIVPGAGMDSAFTPVLDAQTMQALSMLGVDAMPPSVTQVADSVVARLRA